jgi:hypothetical protein
VGQIIGESEWVLCASNINIPDPHFLAYREWIYLGLPTHTLTNHASIPFFFEPNFDTEVAPLEAARRIQKDLSLLEGKHHTLKQVLEEKYKPVVYGDFLRKKVSNNFDGGDRYN